MGSEKNVSFFLGPRVVSGDYRDLPSEKQSRNSTIKIENFFPIKLAHLSSSFSSGMTSIVMLTTTW